MRQPVAPAPDEKDWTWVLDRPCPDCGFDPSTVDGTADVARRARVAVAALRAAILSPGASQRPLPEVWSPLEYGAHARDVCIVMGTRLALLRSHIDPEFPNWDQDATARDSRYWEQDPGVVAAELQAEGERIADAFASVRPQESAREGRRSNGSRFTVDTLGRYFLHDLEHHAHDVAHALVRDVAQDLARGDSATA